ncbi:MAG: PhoH family protein [Candidatus Babeliales bacterium]
MSQRIYVLDTNVLVHDPNAFNTFENAQVGIPITVLEELDAFKSENSERGYSARETIRKLDALREKGSLREGVQLDNGATLRVLFLPESVPTSMPFGVDKHDNLILATVLALKDIGEDVEFITKDINARVKADVLKISTEDYLKDDISRTHFYKGWVQISVPAVSLKNDVPKELIDLERETKLLVNQFVLVSSNNNPFNYVLFRYLGDKRFLRVAPPDFRWPIQARNPQQLMALNLLCDPKVQFVTLFGPAGTGKTFLALLAGLHQVLIQDEYRKMLVSRPVVPLGKDIGYLPGTVEEKLHSWMLPIYDNMELIMHAAQISKQVRPYEESFGKKEKGDHKDHKGYKDHKDDKHSKRKAHAVATLDDLIEKGKLSLEAITYMRGRSIPYQYILIDEVQNLTPHEVKTLVSRVGEGSKIILAGDPYQIDSPYLDFGNNGLTVASDLFKGHAIFGTVYMDHSERSELSQLVSDLWD